MTGDKYRQPGDADKHLADWRFDTAEGDSLKADTLNNGGPISDGDGTERQIWVIANGASDPAEADPEDIIFEESA